MGVAVAETWHHETSLCIDVLGCCGVTDSATTEFCDDTIFNDEVGVVEALDMIHVCACKLGHSFRQNSRQCANIVYYSLHIIGFHLDKGNENYA